MNKRILTTTIVTVVLIGLSGCPGEQTIRPGVWSFETFDEDGTSRGAGGIALNEDGSVSPVLFNGAYVAFATGWFQFGESFTLELENPGGELWERLWFTASVNSATYLEGEARDADTGEVFWPFTARWIQD